jgi:hypothetical protein
MRRGVRGEPFIDMMVAVTIEKAVLTFVRRGVRTAAPTLDWLQGGGLRY